MTKTVRIENADNSAFGVIVQVWDKGYPEGAPDTLAKEIPLLHPTAMTDSSVYITSTRYLVVKEAVLPLSVPMKFPIPKTPGFPDALVVGTPMLDSTTGVQRATEVV